MFDLKRPCSNCPFRKGQGELFALSRLRLDEIKNATAFQCHKTVDYSDDGEPLPPSRPQQCAGLMAVLTRENAPNSIMQVAGRCGVDLKGLDPGNEAYDTWTDVLRAHKFRCE
jgi:hypothetical protein